VRAGDQVIIVVTVTESDEDSYTVAIQATAFERGQAGGIITECGVVIEAQR
jgi:hypothetical protein